MPNIGKQKTKPMLKFVKRFPGTGSCRRHGIDGRGSAGAALRQYGTGFVVLWHICKLPRIPCISLVNDGLMAIFFFMVGLEIKREILEGELSTRAKALFPVATAIGGVAAPALIYLWFNAGTEAARGWAVPSATDIAFSLGVLSLFGSRVPYALKIFLMALAVIDDLIAILIIALFYTSDLSLGAIAAAVVCTALLYALNRRNIKSLLPYALIGFALWLAVFYSGVHATMAGVILGLMLPMQTKNPTTISMGERVLECIHPYVSYGIMPLFAFVNAGVVIHNLQLSQLTNALPLGIALGLLLGKPIGIMSVAALLIMLRKSLLPLGTNWQQFFAVSILAGIGFTMSLFIGNLAFGVNQSMIIEMKLGVMSGSFLSAILGCAMMAFAIKRRP
jgi:NhaA family Na+:H+ antiporter